MEKTSDLFEKFKTMTILDLAKYAQSFNITVSNGEGTAILIGYLDMEKNSDKVVKVLQNGSVDYWTSSQTHFVSAENRK